eukprot:SAG11_NODE_4577_length_1844_cov_3.705444_2_plen_83_part_00
MHTCAFLPDQNRGQIRDRRHRINLGEDSWQKPFLFELEEIAAAATRSAGARRFKSFRMCEELMTELFVLCYRGTQDDADSLD